MKSKAKNQIFDVKRVHFCTIVLRYNNNKLSGNFKVTRHLNQHEFSKNFKKLCKTKKALTSKIMMPSQVGKILNYFKCDSRHS